MEPVTAIAGLSWLVATVASSGPDGSGVAGFALNAVVSGVLGNEAHRLYRERGPGVMAQFAGLSLPQNHDLARAVRRAEADALEMLVEEYRAVHRASWDGTPGLRPAMFLDRMVVLCKGMRAECASKTYAFDLSVTEGLQRSFEGLLGDAMPGGAAALRTEVLAGFTEDCVLEEMRIGLGSTAIPEDFARQFRLGADGRPGFLALFGAFFSAQIKANAPARVIMTTKLLARVEGLAFDSSEILARIETRFGAMLDAIKTDTVAIRRDQEAAAAAAASRHREAMETQRRLEVLVADAAGSGAAAVRAIGAIRDLLRPGFADIDAVEAERIPGLVQRILEQLRNPTVIEEGFSGAVRRALVEAQERVAALRFSDAAHVLDAQLAQIEAEDRDRDRGRAALFAERGRVASLQLRYREAAGYYRRAASAVAFDSSSAWGHAFAAARALYSQGDEFGDNAALTEAIEGYRLANTLVARVDVPLDWARTQNNLGNALLTLSGRESGVERLEEAMGAYEACLAVVEDVGWREWVEGVRTSRDGARAEIGRLLGG